MTETTKTSVESEGVTEKNQISYEQFAALDIRIGTITKVAVAEGADRLLVLTVDFGDMQRQIVSGIREYFLDPTILENKQCPFVVNLETRTIRGLESQGMILAASTADVFALLEPHQPIPAGAPVS
jgi:methionyl-tRNA synthetase